MLCGQDARKKRDAADFEKFQAALAEDGGWMEVTAFRWLPTGHQVTNDSSAFSSRCLCRGISTVRRIGAQGAGCS